MAQKKKVAKKSQKVAKNRKRSQIKTKHLVTYVVNCCPMAKLFNSENEMNKFINSFEVNHDSGDWLDLCVTKISGIAISLDKYHNPFDIN